MAFCTNCGAKLPDGTKFCTGCGAKLETVNTAVPNVQATPVAATIQQPNIPSAPAEANPAPVYQTPQYQQPTQQYTAPQYQQPAQQYGTPQYQQPAQQYQAQQYQQPAQQPAQPKKRKTGLIIGIAVAAIAIIATLVLVLGGSGKDFGKAYKAEKSRQETAAYTDDENSGKSGKSGKKDKGQDKDAEVNVPEETGKYTLNSYTANGQNFDYETIKLIGMDGCYIELRTDGTGTLDLMGTQYEITYGDGYVVYAGSVKWPYTFDKENGTVTLDMTGIIYTCVADESYTATGGEEDTGVTPVAPAAPTASADDRSAEPSSDGDGLTDRTMIMMGYKWLSQRNSSFGKYTTYWDVADFMGCEGLDMGNGGPNSITDKGYHIFHWINKDKSSETLQVTFRYFDKTDRWGVQNIIITGISSNEINAVELPVVPAGALTNSFSFETNGVTVSGKLPEKDWCYDFSKYTESVYNLPDINERSSNSPVIQISCKDSMDKIDFYKSSFENYQETGIVTIGGIEMTVRTYKNIGMQWTEYVGKLDDTHYISIKVSGCDLREGTDADAIIKSLTFKVK